MGIIKKLKGRELVGWTQSPETDVYPITATSAIYDGDNNNLDDIIAALKKGIALAAETGGNGSGTGTSTNGTDGITTYLAFKGAADDATALSSLNLNYAGNPPSGWSASSNVTVAEGQMLYMTTARKQGSIWLKWSENNNEVIWSTPVRLGSNTTSTTGADDDEFNYAYCRANGTSPSYKGVTVNAIETARSHSNATTIYGIRGGDGTEVVCTAETLGVWTDHPMGVTTNAPDEYILIHKYDSTTEDWIFVSMTLWSHYGTNGHDGDGIEYIYKVIGAGESAPSTVWSSGYQGKVSGVGDLVTAASEETLIATTEYQKDDFIPTGWYDEPLNIELTNPNLYVSIRKKSIDNSTDTLSTWGKFTTPKLWSSMPIVLISNDILMVDFSNDNINLTPDETGDTLKQDSISYIKVTLGDTIIPGRTNSSLTYSTDGKYYTIDINEDNTSIPAGSRPIFENSNGSIYCYLLSIEALEQTNYVLGLKITLHYEDDTTTNTFAVLKYSIKSKTYEIIVSPEQYLCGVVETTMDTALIVKIRSRVNGVTSYLSSSEVDALINSDYTNRFYYQIGDNTYPISASYWMSGDNGFAIPFNDESKASVLGITSTTRKITIWLYSYDGTSSVYEDSEDVLIARDGNTGDEGNGCEYIFRKFKEYPTSSDWTSATNSTNPNLCYGKDTTVNGKTFAEDEFIPTDWSDDLLEVDSEWKYLYMATRKYKADATGSKYWHEFGTPVLITTWTESPFTFSVDNDSVYVDDQTGAETMANASFVNLHVYYGKEEITFNSNYEIAVSIESLNGISNIFDLYQASKKSVNAINDGGTISNVTDYNTDGSTTALRKCSYNTSSANASYSPASDGSFAFYLVNKETGDLAKSSYGLHFTLTVKKDGVAVCPTLYQVMPIVVKELHTTGEIYKLIISNDTWVYDGDSNALLNTTTTSTIKVSKIMGASSSSCSFILVNNESEATSVDDSDTQLRVVIPSELVSVDADGSGTMNSKTFGIPSSYSKSTYEVSVYCGNTIVDSETIDCSKNGATGKSTSGTSPYSIILNNDTAVLDLELNDAGVQKVTSTTAYCYYGSLLYSCIWKIKSKSDETGLLSVYQYNGSSATGNALGTSDKVSSYASNSIALCLARTAATVFEAGKTCKYTLAAYASESSTTPLAEKTFTATTYQIEGEGVSYSLNVTPDTIVFDNDLTTSLNTEITITVSKITNGEAENPNASYGTSTNDFTPIEGGLYIVNPLLVNSIKNGVTTITTNLSSTTSIERTFYLYYYDGAKFVKVDTEYIDFLLNGALGDNTPSSSIDGSGSIIVDPSTLEFKFDYLFTPVNIDTAITGNVTFHNMYKISGTLYDVIFPLSSSLVKVTDADSYKLAFTLGKAWMRASVSTVSTPEFTNLDTTAVYVSGYSSNSNYKTWSNVGAVTTNASTAPTSGIYWINCDYATVNLQFTGSDSKTYTFTDTAVRTGLDGYYHNADSSGFVSLYATSNSVSSINQTADNITSMVSGLSPNLYKGDCSIVDSSLIKFTGEDDTICNIPVLVIIEKYTPTNSSTSYYYVSQVIVGSGSNSETASTTLSNTTTSTSENITISGNSLYDSKTGLKAFYMMLVSATQYSSSGASFTIYAGAVSYFNFKGVSTSSTTIPSTTTYKFGTYTSELTLTFYLLYYRGKVTSLTDTSTKCGYKFTLYFPLTSEGAYLPNVTTTSDTKYTVSAKIKLVAQYENYFIRIGTASDYGYIKPTTDYDTYSHTFTASGSTTDVIIYPCLYDEDTNTYTQIGTYTSSDKQYMVYIADIQVEEGELCTGWKASGLSISELVLTSDGIYAKVKKESDENGVYLDETKLSIHGSSVNPRIDLTPSTLDIKIYNSNGVLATTLTGVLGTSFIPSSSDSEGYNTYVASNGFGVRYNYLNYFAAYLNSSNYLVNSFCTLGTGMEFDNGKGYWLLGNISDKYIFHMPMEIPIFRAYCPTWSSSTYETCYMEFPSQGKATWAAATGLTLSDSDVATILKTDSSSGILVLAQKGDGVYFKFYGETSATNIKIQRDVVYAINFNSFFNKIGVSGVSLWNLRILLLTLLADTSGAAFSTDTSSTYEPYVCRWYNNILYVAQDSTAKPFTICVNLIY